MIRKFICFLISMLLIATVSHSFLTNAQEIKNIEVKNEKFFFSKPVVNHEKQYAVIDFLEANSLLKNPGKPALPIYTKTFKFPFGTNIKEVICKPFQINEIILSEEIKPSPEPMPINSISTLENFETLTKDQSIYNSENFYPNKWYDYNIGCGLDDNNRAVYLNINLFPVQYSPGKNLILFADKIELNIQYEKPIEPIIFPDLYDLVIICKDQYKNALEPFVDYKKDCGLNPIIVSTSEIYNGDYFPTQGRDQAEKIKYFIKDSIENWNSKYILIVGTDNQIPCRDSYCYDGEESYFMSDLYYADIYNSNKEFCSWDYNNNDIFGEYTNYNKDKVDLYPDVYFGRWNCKNEYEVSIVSHKIINYECTASYTEDWFNRIVFCGGDTHEDNKNVPEGQRVNYAIHKKMNPYGFDSDFIWASNGLLEDATNIDNSIENGCGFLHMQGHANPYGWSTHPINNFNRWIPSPNGYTHNMVDDLENNNELPICVLGGCSICKFSGSYCFGWSFLKNPNGGGIASFGNSGLGWGYVGDWCDKGLGGGISVSAFRSYLNSDTNTIGEMWCNAISDYISTYGLSLGGKDYKTIEEWQSFCDPSMHIKKFTEKPDTPSMLDGPSSGDAGDELMFSTYSNDADEEYIKYCFDWGDGTFGWSDWYASGEQVQLSHIWDRGGDYEIKVKARDENGVDSSWSNSYSIHIKSPEFRINQFSCVLGKGEIEIENIGESDADSVEWEIEIQGGFLGNFYKSDSGSIQSLQVGEKATVDADIGFGFGPVDIRIKVNSLYGIDLDEEMQGYFFIIFLKII